jgi:hypothetical protein
LLRAFASTDETTAGDDTTNNRTNTALTMRVIRNELEIGAFVSRDDPTKRLIREHERIVKELIDIFPDLTFTRIIDT